MSNPQTPEHRPGRAAPTAKDQPAPPARSPKAPVDPAPPKDEGWEKGRPKDTGRGGA